MSDPVEEDGQQQVEYGEPQDNLSGREALLVTLYFFLLKAVLLASLSSPLVTTTIVQHVQFLRDNYALAILICAVQYKLLSSCKCV